MTIKTEETRKQDRINNLFRALLDFHRVEGNQSYEWLDGEAWYRGEPITATLSANEGKAVAHMIYIITH